jgi:hypothetical protein
MRTMPLVSVAALVSLVSGGTVSTQEPQAVDNYLIPSGVPRFALAVGVENYEFLERVPNALNDLDAATLALQRAGFDTVIAEANPTAARLRTAIKRLTQLGAETGRPAVIAMFFAGHGFQDGTDNFIVPRDAQPSTLLDDSIPVANIVSKLALRTAGVTFVFLDACRTLTPLAQPVNPGDRPIPSQPGFAPGANFKGAIQIFSAKWGQAAISQAHQGDVNSPYTEALQRYLNKPGDNIATTYGKVSRWVRSKTIREQDNSSQEPEILSVSSIDTIRFMPLSTPAELEAEDRHWRETLAANRGECVKEFVLAFPDSRYAVAALRWLAENPSPSTHTAGGDECPER